jgi:hypothetical protein
MRPWSLRCSVVLSVVALIFLNVCGGDTPSRPVAGPSPPVNPEPPPPPTPDPPLSASCQRIGRGAPAQKCPMERATFQQEVDDAILTLQSEQPGIFNGNRILSTGAYYVGLIRILDRRGICAGFDGEELAVKTDNSFNDQYDIETSTRLVRIGPATYRATCYPAAFPLHEPPLIPAPPGCNLPSSRVVQCGREPAGGQYYQDVNAAIGEVLAARPELFDYSDTSNLNAAREGLPGVRNLEGYANAVAEALTKKGYCARWDSKELQVKRGSNQFNEQYAITFSLTHVRRDPNMYRSSCYPASF